MSTDTSREIQSGSGADAAVGIAYFAGTLLIMVGAFQIIQGVVALANETFYVIGKEYVFHFNVSAWGWAHLLLGALLVLVGIFLFRGAGWARWTAVVLAVVSAVANFMWLPYYPVWAVLAIVADVAIVWALTVHGRAIDEALS